jgi:hypothetical protein
MLHCIKTVKQKEVYMVDIAVMSLLVMSLVGTVVLTVLSTFDS